MATGLAALGDDNFDACLGLPDRILDIDLTPNRGDCLSVRGVAREVAVAEGVAMQEPTVTPVSATVETQPVVYIDAPERCAAYAARAIEGT